MVYSPLGYYPHPDVPPVTKKPIQKEVVYCPDLRFMAFDIAVIHEPSADASTTTTQSDEEEEDSNRGEYNM